MVDIVDILNRIIWSPVLVILLVGAGLYFTVRTRCVQVRKFPLMFRLLFGSALKKQANDSLSSFQAFFVALAGRVGTGNIVGVATAIALGGPGSVFWMWVVAFFGAATAFTESTLANKYQFEYKGKLRGGPTAYILKGLHSPGLATLFAILTILGYGMLLVLVQANGLSTAFENSFDVNPLWTGIALAFVLGMVIIGGVTRIAKVATRVCPFMAIVYILVAIVILIANIEVIPSMFGLIFSSAFGANSIFGGMCGSAVSMGVKRGLFSNEAGQGGGAIVSAAAKVEHPAQQGLVQAFSVYIDTLLVCTATALMILCTGQYNVFDASGNIIAGYAPELGNNYVAFTQSAIDTVFNGFGGKFVTIALAFFAFTTIMAFYFYAESSFVFLFSKSDGLGNRNEKLFLNLYRDIFLLVVVAGAVIVSDTVWKMGDIGLGLTVWLNVITLLILFPEALALLRDFEKR